jgi:hypothetical protein
VYVYVVNEDDHGEAYLLFPTAQLEPKNPLPSGVEHLLPGHRNGQRFFWQITSDGGREHLIVVASRMRLVDFEAELLSLDRPTQGREPLYPALTVAAKATLRGIGGLVTAAPAERASESSAWSTTFAYVPALTPANEDARGVWIRRLDLVHGHE